MSVSSNDFVGIFSQKYICEVTPQCAGDAFSCTPQAQGANAWVFWVNLTPTPDF